MVPLPNQSIVDEGDIFETNTTALCWVVVIVIVMGGGTKPAKEHSSFFGSYCQTPNLHKDEGLMTIGIQLSTNSNYSDDKRFTATAKDQLIDKTTAFKRELPRI